MALIYFEGFNESNNISNYPSNFNSAAIQNINGKNYCYFPNNNSSVYINPGNTNGQFTNFYVGMRIYIPTSPQPSSYQNIQFLSIAKGTYYFGISFNLISFQLTIYDRNGTTQAYTPANIFSYNVPFYLEIYALLGNPGTVTLKINGLTVATSTSVYNINDSYNSVSYYEISNQYAQTLYFTDMYFCDNTSSFNNTFLGPVSVLNSYATTSVVSNFTPVGAANNVSVDNTTPPNIGNIYNSSATVGAYDLVKVANTFNSTIQSVLGVQTVIYANTSTPNSTTMSTIIQSSGINSISNAFGISATPTYFYGISQVDPATNAAWTLASVANVNVGYINQS